MSIQFLPILASIQAQWAGDNSNFVVMFSLAMSQVFSWIECCMVTRWTIVLPFDFRWRQIALYEWFGHDL